MIRRRVPLALRLVLPPGPGGHSLLVMSVALPVPDCHWLWQPQASLVPVRPWLTQVDTGTLPVSKYYML